MPSMSMKRFLLAADDWRRMARTSAAYCLFWLTFGSRFWARDVSQGIMDGLLPMSEAIEGREERFSSTPGGC